jgi:glycosyltransferase involved in cell wall biosynthesis
MKPGATVLVTGHLPPPVTGENLCRRQLEGVLRAQGRAVVSRRAHHPANLVFAGRSVWLLAGKSKAGHLRDSVLLLFWRLLGCRVCIYIHNQSWNYFLKRAAWWRWLGGRAFRFVVLTDQIAGVLRGAGLEVRRLDNTLVQGVEPAVDGRQGTPAVRRLVWMGAVMTEKGFPKACRIFEELRRRDADWRFDVYGTGPLAGGGQALPGVVFHGFVDDAAKDAAWRAGGVLILPSCYVNETQPLAIIEALAYGLPFVATPIGGIPAMRGDPDDPAGAVLRFEESDARWAEVIEGMLGDYGRCSAAAHATYWRRFSRVAYAEGVAAIMEEVTSRRSGS